MSTFKPPCNEMSFSVNTDTEHRKIGWSGITNNTMRFKIKYLDNKFQEIVNEKAFSFEMFWSSIGGFIGIFLGYSLLQVPQLLIYGLGQISSVKQA